MSRGREARVKTLLKTQVLVAGVIAVLFVPAQLFHLMNQPSTLLVAAGAAGLALFGWSLFQGGTLWLKW